MSVNLAATESGHGKHWTKDEIAQREKSEVKGNSAKKVMAPKWLKDEAQRKEFYALARQLVELNVGFCQMDADFLAWYLTTRQEYLDASEYVQDAIRNGDMPGAAKWTKTRNTLFSEAKACAGELGLTVSARCKLVVPDVPSDDDSPLDELRKRFQILHGSA